MHTTPSQSWDQRFTRAGEVADAMDVSSIYWLADTTNDQQTRTQAQRAPGVMAQGCVGSNGAGV
jgi:hypothetical protein